MKRKILIFFICFLIVILFISAAYLLVDIQNKSLTKHQNNTTNKEYILNKNNSWNNPNNSNNKNLISNSSDSINETQYDALNLSELKVPGTIAMAISETYPFKKSKVWNMSFISKGETITSYIFLANYRNESHDFLIFYFINYTQQPSYLGEEQSTVHYISLNKDESVIFALKTQPFEQNGEYLLQIGAAIDPYKTSPTGKLGFLDTGFFYFSPKVVIYVNQTTGGDKNDQG